MRVVVSTSRWRTAKVHGHTVRIGCVRKGTHFLDCTDTHFVVSGGHPTQRNLVKVVDVQSGFFNYFSSDAQVLPVDPTR